MAEIIKDKEPHTIVKTILKILVLCHGVGPGMPQRFQFDNGGEFNNPQVIELAEKHGLTLQPITTAAKSPFSNGLCKRNHAVVDLMVEKIMDGDPAIKESDALN